jgi:hypothetical protein
MLIGQKCPFMGEGGNAVALLVAPLQHPLQHYRAVNIRLNYR